MAILRLSDNPADKPGCHSEFLDTLKMNSAKNLIDSATYTSEILRLTPQNDVIGQPLLPLLVFQTARAMRIDYSKYQSSP